MTGLWIALAAGAILFIIGTPIYVSFGVAGVFGVAWWIGVPLEDVGLWAYHASYKFTLLAIPLFIFAGNTMLYGGASRPLIDFINSLIGHFPGGLGIVMVVSCGFFGALCGSTLATIAAIGTIMVPYMVERGYPRPYSSGLLSCAGTLGNIIPPSIILIIFGELAEKSISVLFAATLIPGLVMVGILAVTVAIVAKRRGIKTVGSREEFSWRERRRFFVRAIPALIMPVIILGGIYGGIFTPTEAAAVAVFYGLFIGFLVYRKLNWKSLWGCLSASVRSTAVILILIIMAVFLSRIFTYMHLPQMIMGTVTAAHISPLGFLLLSDLIIILLGTLIEGTPLLLLSVPLIVPPALALGVQPYHLGIIFCAGIIIGQFTPPVGIAVYMASSTAEETPENTIREGIPFFIALVIGLLVITLVPELSLWMPRMMGMYLG